MRIPSTIRWQVSGTPVAIANRLMTRRKELLHCPVMTLKRPVIGRRQAIADPGQDNDANVDFSCPAE